METLAQANVGFYIDQTNASVKNSMELAREVAFSALGDPMLQKNMQRTEFYLSSMGRGALEQMVGSVTAYQSAWSRNVLSSIYLFRDDGQYTFYSAKGAYAQEQRRMENICNQSRELSSAKTLFQIPGAPENMVYFLLDYKNIDTMAHLGKPGDGTGCEFYGQCGWVDGTVSRHLPDSQQHRRRTALHSGR